MTGMRIGILVFEGVEEMDFAGPWEVLTAAAEGTEGYAVFTVAETTAPVRCEKGLIVIPDRTYDTVHDLDVLLIPGGSGARREGQNPATVAWIGAVAPGCAWIASVCTGAFLLLAAGPGRNRRITTHHRFVDRLRALGGAEVVDGVRFVRDGNVVSSAGGDGRDRHEPVARRTTLRHRGGGRRARLHRLRHPAARTGLARQLSAPGNPSPAVPRNRIHRVTRNVRQNNKYRYNPVTRL